MPGRISSLSDPISPAPVEYRPRSSRREFLALAGAAALAAVLPGCGDGGPGTFNQIFTPLVNTLVTIDPGTFSLGTDNGQTVSRIATLQNLFTLPRAVDQPANGNYNVMFFGTKDASGTATRVTQSLTWFGNSRLIRTAYGTNGLPTRAVSGEGYSVTFSWDLPNNRLIIRGFDANGNLVGGSIVQGAGNDYTIQPLAQALGRASAESSQETSRAAATREGSLGSRFLGIFLLFALAGALLPWIGRFADDLVSHLRAGQLFGAGGLGALLFGTTGSSPFLGILVLILLAVFLPFAGLWSNYASLLEHQSNKITTSEHTPSGVPTGAQYDPNFR